MRIIGDYVGMYRVEGYLEGQGSLELGTASAPLERV